MTSDNRRSSTGSLRLTGEPLLHKLPNSTNSYDVPNSVASMFTNGSLSQSQIAHNVIVISDSITDRHNQIQRLNDRSNPWMKK